MPTLVKPEIEKSGMENGIVRVQWAMVQDSVGESVPYGAYPDRCVQIARATIDGSTPIIIEGSNDSVNVPDDDSAWETLTDNLGNPLSFTDEGIKFIVEGCNKIRPRVEDGATNGDVMLVAVES